MCLILFSWQQTAAWPLVMAANRDEFHARPTQQLNWWDDQPGILAGRDLQQGGTWCGINRQGRFAAITNYRDPDQTAVDKVSRGEILKQYLAGADTPDDFLGKLDDRHDDYNGFNLLLGNPDELFYYSNMQRDIQQLQAGLYGLSNGLLDTPWPKLVSGKKNLQQAIAAGAESSDLFEVLACQQRPDDECLPITGVSLEWERLLSPCFIQSPDYGTRSSTLLQIDTAAKVTMQERSFNPAGELITETAFSFIPTDTAQADKAAQD